MGKSKKKEKNGKTAKNVFLNTIFTILKIVIPLSFLAGILLVIFIIAGAEKIDGNLITESYFSSTGSIIQLKSDK